MDVWERERQLARSTVVWGLASTVGGAAMAATRDPWRRAFGLQTAGWGGATSPSPPWTRLQDRRMRRLSDAYAVDAQEAERVTLRRLLVANVVADAGYVVLGARLARDARPRVAGAGVAIIVQGAFLFLHDGRHALGARPGGHLSS